MSRARKTDITHAAPLADFEATTAERVRLLFEEHGIVRGVAGSHKPPSVDGFAELAEHTSAVRWQWHRRCAFQIWERDALRLAKALHFLEDALSINFGKRASGNFVFRDRSR